MNQPVTQKEWSRACDLGSAARRAGKSKDGDPYASDHTDKGYLLSTAWLNSWESEDSARAKR